MARGNAWGCESGVNAQWEPLDALVYSALVCHVGPGVAADRMPPELQIACSYRFQVADGSYLAGRSGWRNFTSNTEELPGQFSHVLVTDMTDFCNQIYLHRLNNGIEAADAALKPTLNVFTRTTG